MLHYVILRCITLYCATFRYITLHYVTLRYIGNNPRRMWQTVNSLLGEKKTTAVPVFTAKDYHDYIDKKIADIRVATSHEGEPAFVLNDTVMSLCVFQRITVDDVVTIIRESPSKQCSLGPLPTWLLKDFVTILGPYIINIINISLLTGVFPKSWERALISPLLKKTGLDEAAPANFRPVSNLPLL